MLQRICGLTCAFVFIAATTALPAATISWSDSSKSVWVKNEAGIVLGSDDADAPFDIEVSGRELLGRSVLVTSVAGGANEFATISEVPESGYTDRLSIDAGQIVIARLADGRYAKLLIKASTYNLDNPSPNAHGIQVTVVLSR